MSKHSSTPMGRIILLNGSSSAGKSTLAKTLQRLLPDPYQHLALDQYRDGLPDGYRGLNSPSGSTGASGLNIVPVNLDGEPVTRIEFGEHGEAVLRAMRQSVAEFAKQGLNVVVDDLLFKPQYLLDYAVRLAEHSVWCVGVKCELWRVNEREAARLGRFPGTAQAHMEELHGHGLAYDIEVDTTYDSAEQCARRIIAALARPPTALHAWHKRWQHSQTTMSDAHDR